MAIPSHGRLESAFVAEQQADKKPETGITAAKIALAGTILAALIGATATISVALAQHPDSAPTSAAPATDSPAATPGSPRTIFDESALEGRFGVEKILIDDYGVPADQIQSVDCPADQEVKAGNKFTCYVQLGGDNPGEKKVDITVVDDSGEYQVGLPQDHGLGKVVEG